jgi:1-phosphofructokinase
LNPAIDKTVYVDKLEFGELNRIKSVRLDPGGKGINVSKALSTYGIEQKATGILAGMNGRVLLSLLERYDFKSDFLVVEGETRTNLKIHDSNTNLITELNEIGPFIQTDNVNMIKKHIKHHLNNCELMILSGSFPTGIPSDFYATCIEMASSMNVRTILDADGEALKLGCSAFPFAIKPNLKELECLSGKALKNYSEILDEINLLQKTGIELILVSLGKDGSILSYKNKTFHALTPSVKVKSTVGAGDSMVAALAYCILNDFDAEKTAKITCAAGYLTTELDGSDMVDWKNIKEVYKDVKIKEII